MVLIYSKEKTPRLEYTFRLIFEKILLTEVSFTNDPTGFRSAGHPRINYSDRKLDDELFLKPDRLLFLKGTGCPEPGEVVYRGEKYFFPSSDDSFLPFDPFAATFYLVTRLEEYHETEPDKYGRYRHENSILKKNGLIRKPVINTWALFIAEKLKEKYPWFQILAPKFSFISTIDIDSAWSYLHKGFLRNTGGFLRDMMKARFGEAILRLTVLGRLKRDPFDTYEFLCETFRGHEEKVVFFILLGDYGRFNKNIAYNNPSYRRLIRQISGRFATGIHASFNGSGGGISGMLAKEKIRLHNITEKETGLHRQHFLYLKFPGTYRNLLENKITSDFTMGYPDECGFRAGTCTPYPFYDLTEEKSTDLTVYPFQVMDVSLRDYLGLSSREAWETIFSLMTGIKKTGGTFISIWHNESLTREGRWQGYREVFAEMNRLGFLWSGDES